jgi:hypothetical protein
MKRKINAEDILQYLKSRGINKLYHFTDRGNIESIIANGGLYSWEDCYRKGIKVPYPGGGALSRDLDRRYNLQDYVRTSLVKDHPMQYVAMNEGRISNPVILEIDLDVAVWDGVKYSDMNATKNGMHCGDSFDDLKNIHFDVFNYRYLDLDDSNRPYYQAEILIPNFIPLQYVTNIGNFGITLPTQCQVSVSKTPYSAQITRATPTAFIFMLDQSCSMSSTVSYKGKDISKGDAVAMIVNQQIEELINRCIKTNEIRHYYDLAMIGYGDKINCGWHGDLEGKEFASPAELHDHPFKRITTTEEKHTRNGIVRKEVEKISWVDPDTSGNWTDMYDAFEKAKALLENWMRNYKDKDCYPPTIINITDGEYNNTTYEDMLLVTNEIKSMFTNDGNVQIFNIHISDSGNVISFPTDKTELGGDNFAEKLFDFSSLLPLRYNDEISKVRNDNNTGIRHKAMAMNADMGTLIQLMDIGTPTNINNNR